MINQPQFIADVPQPEVGIVFPEQKPVFRPRGKKTIRLFCSQSHQIIDQYTDIGLSPVQYQRLLVSGIFDRINSRHKPLRRRLFISGSTVDLPGQKQSRNPFRLKRGGKLQRINIIILYRISGPYHLDLLKTLYALKHCHLYINGKTCRHTVRIYLDRVYAFRLKEYLVPFLFREPHHLIFHRGTITGADTFYDPGVHRRPVRACPDDIVGFLIGICDMTRKLRKRWSACR